MTQAQLAERLGVSAPYIAGLELGHTNITVGQLAKVADALGTGLEIRFPVLQEVPPVLSQ